MPSNDGKFNLSKSCTGEVYSILGVKIAEGKGDVIDISKASKGIYLLRTKEWVAKKLSYCN